MCGFIGRILGPGARVPPALTAGLPWLAQRGPDSQREWCSPGGEVELLHARLAIVDKTAVAHQPLTAADHSVTVAFAGEVYNHQEIRKGLTDYSFQTNSDTEILLALYAHFGIAGLSRAKGMVACAIVDTRRRTVLLFRDAVGKKPLFVARWAGQVLFGSSILPLVAASGAEVETADDAPRCYWHQEFIDPTGSVFKDAESVLPGEALLFDFSGRLISSTRITPDTVAADRATHPAEARANLQEMISVSVRRRLQDNPSPCLLLSGGLDSTVLAVAMTEEATKLGIPLRAITLGAALPFLNDEPYARYAAARLGLPLETVTPARLVRSKHAIADACERAVARQDEPLGMLSYFSRYQLIELVKDYSRIVLTGDGGDEVFLGYSQASGWVASPDALSGSVQVLCGPPLPHWMSEWGRRQSSVSLLGHGFAVVDRASAEQGVEVRCPFLDWDVMAFARSLSSNLLLEGGHSKGLLLGLLGGWPRRFLFRRKRGFTLNLRWAWLRSRFEGLRDIVDRSAQERLSEFLPEPLRRPAQQWQTQEIFQNFPSAWKLVVWTAFERRWSEAKRLRPQLSATNQRGIRTSVLG
jgi:asparagine synthase (glutamine-hydrolysing)